MVTVKASSTDKGCDREVSCTHCQRPLRVAHRAMSVFCPHCKQRLILEDFRIKTYRASRLFATCGDIIVEKGGFVAAPIRVTNLTIRGRVQGSIVARGVVAVASTGQVRGDIRAPRLTVASGATMDGFLRITPETADSPG